MCTRSYTVYDLSSMSIEASLTQQQIFINRLWWNTHTLSHCKRWNSNQLSFWHWLWIKVRTDPGSEEKFIKPTRQQSQVLLFGLQHTLIFAVTDKNCLIFFKVLAMWILLLKSRNRLCVTRDNGVINTVSSLFTHAIFKQMSFINLRVLRRSPGIVQYMYPYIAVYDITQTKSRSKICIDSYVFMFKAYDIQYWHGSTHD